MRLLGLSAAIYRKGDWRKPEACVPGGFWGLVQAGEEGAGVGGGGGGEGGEGEGEGLGDVGGGGGEVGGFVAAATVGHGGEVGGVGLEEDAGGGNFGKDVAQGAVFEGDDAVDAEVVVLSLIHI